MTSKSSGNWRNNSVIELSDSDGELVESSLIVKSEVDDSDDDQIQSSFTAKSNECNISSSGDDDSDDSFNVNNRKKHAVCVLISDDEDEYLRGSEKYFSEDKSSDSAVAFENNSSKSATVDSLVGNVENCSSSIVENSKNLSHSASDDVSKGKLCSSFSENLQLNDSHLHHYENNNPYSPDSRSAKLESFHNSSATSDKVEIQPSSPKCNLQESEEEPSYGVNENHCNKIEGKDLSGSFSKNLPLENSMYHDEDNVAFQDSDMQKAILESLRENSQYGEISSIMKNDSFLHEDEEVIPLNYNFQESNTGFAVEESADTTDNETLLGEKLRLEYEIKDVMASIKNKKTTINSINLNILPDKGLKLKNSMAKEERSLETLFEQLNRVKNKLKSSRVNNVNLAEMIEEKPLKLSSFSSNDFKEFSFVGHEKKSGMVDEKPFKFSSLPSANIGELGEKALENYRVEQSLTVESLRSLHNSLKNCPSEDEVVADPFGLKIPLMNHQKQALVWQIWREKEKPSGGILADDMGLGKTLTMISLILKRKEEEENDESADDDDFICDQKRKCKGGTLIVCPSSLIGQWESEIRRRVRHDLLSYEIHHGQNREKKPRRLTRYDIVITSYNIARVEFENFSEGENKVGTLYQIRWKRIILDEAHTIRNYQSKTSKAMFMLKATHRWALTGTPVHNKTQDFFALVKFLRCKPFDDITVWKKWVEAKDETGVQRLNLLTKALLLRRTKNLLMYEGKLQSLPEKFFETVLVQLGKEEWTLYEEVSNFSKTLLSQLLYQRAEKQELLTEGVLVTKSKSNPFENGNPFVKHPALNKLYQRLGNMQNVKTHEILVLLLRLRQICCHPALIKSMVEKDAFLQDGIVEEEGTDLDLLEQMSALNLNGNENGSAEDRDDELESSKSNIFNLNNRIFDPEWPSSKIQAILQLLEDTILKTDDKVVIVSQWTSMLEIISNFLKKLKNCKCETLNGKVPVDKRMNIVSEFNSSSSSIRVLLLSLTAGGTGLNLIGGNHLILTDLHWNPQQEAQACDRIYRMGQTKPVKIYKFYCAETIEERIQQLQLSKLAMADGILSGAKQVQVGKLSLNDLKMLFNVK